MKRTKRMLLTALMAAMSIASMQAEKVAQAIWTAGNTTLTFIYDETVYNEGDTFNEQTVTNVWRVENFSPQYRSYIEEINSNNWNEEVRKNMTRAEFKESFIHYAPTNTTIWFCNCVKLVEIKDFVYLNTYNVSDMSYMFYGCSSLTSLDVSGFNTDNVTSMKGMFSGCSSLTILDVSGFKTDNVKYMNGMFYHCSSLTSLDVSGFKTDNVTSMHGMFSGCWCLTSLDVSGFKTDNVRDMGSMFSSCSLLTSLDVSGFKTDNVTRMDYMFFDCRSLTSLDVSGFNTDNVDDMSSMFSNCSGLTSLDVSGFKTDQVRYMGSMFSYCSGLTSLDVSGLKTGHVTRMDYMFKGCSGLTSLDLSCFFTVNVSNMESMFEKCTKLQKVYVHNGWTTENVTNSNHMFYNCTNIEGGQGTKYDDAHSDKEYACIDGGNGLPGYFTRSNKSIRYAYGKFSDDGTTLTYYYDSNVNGDCISIGIIVKRRNNLTTVVFDNSFAENTSLTSTSLWFNGCEELTTITGIENLNTDNVTSMYGMFSSCPSLTSLDVSGFKTDNVRDMGSMFAGCSRLANLDLSSFKTDNVTRMDEMFSSCKSLTSLDLSSFKTDNVTDMSNMFWMCSRLTNLDLSGFKTDNVTKMGSMFYGCRSLTSLDLSGFKTDNVTSMSEMFSFNSNLRNLSLGSGFVAKYSNSAFSSTTNVRVYVDADAKETVDASLKNLGFTARNGYITTTDTLRTVLGKGGSYWGTYYNFVASMTVPEGVEAYTAYVDGDTLALARIEGGIIPKGNAVVLKSAKAEVVLDVNTTPRSLIEGNALAGVDVDTVLPENGYALAAVDDMAGLWRTADEGAQVKGHEGYLPYAGDDAAAGYPFPGEGGDTVGIDAVHNAQFTVHGAVYNLQGQRVRDNANAHGLYVVDRKKLYVR